MRHDLDENWEITERDRRAFDSRLERLGAVVLAAIFAVALFALAVAQW